MRRVTVMFSGAVRVATYAAGFHVLFTVVSHMSHGDPSWSSLPVWLVGCIASFVVNAWLLDRRPALAAVAVANAVLFAVQLAAMLALSPMLAGMGARVILGVMVAGTTGLAYWTAANPPSVSLHVMSFDIYLLALVFMVMAAETIGVPGSDIPALVVLLVLDLAALVVLRGIENRSGSTALASPAGGVVFAIVAVAAFALVAFGLVHVVAFSADSMLSTLGRAVKAVADAVYGVAYAVAFWFAQVFGTDFEAAPVDGSEGAGDGADEIVELGATTDFSGVGIVLGIVAAIVVIALVVRFRGKRLGSAAEGASSPARRARITRTRSGRLAQLIDQLRFNITALRYRNTPAGTLVWLERWARRRGQARSAGETPSEFFARIAPNGELAPLAQALESQFFGDGSTKLSPTTCANLRQAFKAAQGAKPQQ